MLGLLLFELGLFGLFALGLFLGFLRLQFALLLLCFLFLALLQGNLGITLGLQLLLAGLRGRR
ncbi:hypothetical protein, partial [Comamonas sp.]